MFNSGRLENLWTSGLKPGPGTVRPVKKDPLILSNIFNFYNPKIEQSNRTKYQVLTILCIFFIKFLFRKSL